MGFIDWLLGHPPSAEDVLAGMTPAATPPPRAAGHPADFPFSDLCWIGRRHDGGDPVMHAEPVRLEYATGLWVERALSFPPGSREVASFDPTHWKLV